MTPEPSSGAAAIVAAVSTVLLALLGVDYYSLLWSTFSAFLSSIFSVRPTDVTVADWKRRNFVTLILSSLIGAALGTLIAEQIPGSTRAALIVASVICGSAPRPIVSAFVNGIVNQINRRAGNAPDGSPPPNP